MIDILCAVVLSLVLYICVLRYELCVSWRGIESVVRKMMCGKSVILVGNGSSLNHARRGRVIDGFDIVVRFNGFKLRGSSVTGVRTDVHVQSEFSLLFNEFAFGALPLVAPSQLRCSGINVGVRGNCIGVGYVEGLRGVLPPGKFPSTGLIMIHMLMKLGVKFSIIGFDGNLESASYSEAHYYADDGMCSIGHGQNHCNERSVIECMSRSRLSGFKIL